MTRLSKTFFSDDELKCKCCGLLILDPQFDEYLTKLRINFGEAMIVNSCCRCLKHNKEVGGAPKSFHICDKPAWPKLKGTGAADISFTKLFYRNRLARLAWQMGFRIGLAKTFLHLDIGHITGSTPQTIFIYSGVTKEELEKFENIVKEEYKG